MKILALTRYDNLGASSRLRTLQYFKFMTASGVFIRHEPLFSNHALIRRYRFNGYGFFHSMYSYISRIYILFRSASLYDILWIEKEALPWLPTFMEKYLLRNQKYILDYDDALFHKYDQHRFKLVRFLLGNRIDMLMRDAELVVGGNQYLCDRAKNAGAKRVALIPTVVDLSRYRLKIYDAIKSDEPLKIVWIGTPSTVKYLSLISKVLKDLSKSFRMQLVVIGAEIIIDGVDVRLLKWREETEVSDILLCDIGIMPLSDSLWEKGKCGYKLIQYMACALPVVASGVGVNSEIINHGENGYLANEDDSWREYLSKLLSDQFLRRNMGLKGRDKVERSYSLESCAPRLFCEFKSIINP